MADPNFADFIPREMRALAERNVQQAQKAFEDLMSATHRAVSTFEGQATAAQANAREIHRQVMAFSERNMAASLAFMQKLWAVRDAQQAVQLHADYVKAQVEALTDQARELARHGATAAKSGGRQTD